MAANLGMLSRVTGALNILSPNLNFLMFPSGTKVSSTHFLFTNRLQFQRLELTNSQDYGIQLHPSDPPFTAPFIETIVLPPHLSTENWYASFQSHLTTASTDRSCTWAEVRPDAISGFVPNGSAFNLAAHWATYLSADALLEGPYPGTAQDTNFFSTTPVHRLLVVWRLTFLCTPKLVTVESYSISRIKNNRPV